MTKQVKTILGFCPNHAHAEEAVDKLRLSGFRNTDVSALMPDNSVIFGSVMSWAAGSDIPAHEADIHNDWISQGGIVLCVRCSNAEWEKRACQVLKRALTAAGAC